MNIFYDTQKHLDAIHQETKALFKPHNERITYLVTHFDFDIITCVTFTAMGEMTVKYLNVDNGNIHKFTCDKTFIETFKDKEEMRFIINKLNIQH